MKLANIYPVSNQELYKDESYVMLLAHLLKYYNRASFRKDAYIIMDNGMYENSQVSTDVSDIIEKAEEYSIRVNEFIIPDVLNKKEETIHLFEKNIPAIKNYIGKYNFMFVAQAASLKELRESISYINGYKEELPNITVGIAKLIPVERNSKEFIDILKECKYPIHVLGIKDNFNEVKPLENIVRGVDSSQLAYMAKNEKCVPVDCLHYSRKEAENSHFTSNIDLENDFLSSKKIREFRDIIMPQLCFER